MHVAFAFAGVGVGSAHGILSHSVNFPFFSSLTQRRRITTTTTTRSTTTIVSLLLPPSSSSVVEAQETDFTACPCSCPCGNTSVGRRRLILGASSAAAAAVAMPAKAEADLLPLNPIVSLPADDPTLQVMIERYHPRRPDWYEEIYAIEMEQGMGAYESEIAAYKERLFTGVAWNFKKVLEFGVGTGPNFKYYGSSGTMDVIGVDPNKKMEKYARSAAEAAGLPANNFNFIEGVGESLAIGDGTIDAVVGTLVLCSVKDVKMALREVKRVLKPGGCYLFLEHVAAPDGSFLRIVQSILDPLQQFVADGCHLTRDTGSLISDAGFSQVKLETAFLSSFLPISPHVYGVARK